MMVMCNNGVPHQREWQEEDSSEEDDLEEYLQNVEAARTSSDDSEVEEGVKLSRFGESAAELGAGPAIEDPIHGESESGWETEDSDQASSSGDSDSQLGLPDHVGVQTSFPVQVKGELAGSGTFKSQLSRGRRKSSEPDLTPGGKTGGRDAHGRKLRSQKPVDNRQLKKERVQAMRARRAVDNGFDLRKVDKQLQDFVKRDGDMEAFPPMVENSRRYLRKLAALYGLKSGEQQSRKKKRIVVVQATRKTKLPEGNTKVQVNELLEEFAQTVAPPKPAVNGSWRLSHTPQSQTGGGKDKKRQAGQEPQDLSGKLYRAFVASGCVTDGGEDGVVIVTSHTSQSQQAEPRPADTLTGGEESLEAVQPALLRQPSLGDELGVEGRAQLGLGSAETASVGLGFPGSGARDLQSAQPCQEAAEGPDAPGMESPATLAVIEDREPSGAALDSLSLDDRSPAYDALQGYTGEPQPWLPSILQTKAQCKKANKKMAKEARRAERQATGAAEPMVQATAVNYGEFERHTRGIGSKLMAQMGYLGEGTGLGSRGQGMAEPLKALQRPKKLGLGA